MDRADLKRAPGRIDTPRLRLEAPDLAHAAAFVESINISLPALGFIAWTRDPRDLAWGEGFMRSGLKVVDAGECLIYYVFEKATGDYVGRIDLHSFDFEAPRAEVGYVGDVRQAGRGLMREAVLAVVDAGFALGFARVHALSDARNLRALHFAETLGFQREGMLRNWERGTDGSLCEQVMFAAYNPRAL